MKRVLTLSLALAAAGCTLLTRFDPDGQPCDPGAPPAMQCLTDAGYFCSAEKICTRSGTAVVDAGQGNDAGATFDAGAADAGVDAGHSVDAGRDGG